LSTDHILTSPAAEAASRRAGGSAVPRTASPFWLGIGCAIASIVVLVSPLDRYGLSALDIIALATLAYAAPGVIYEYVQIHGLRAPVLTRPLSAAGLRFALLKAFGFSQIVLAALCRLCVVPRIHQGQLHGLP
jgi:hypothetical protein